MPGRPSPPKKKKRAVGQHHGDLRVSLLRAGIAAIDDGVEPGLREVTRRAGVTAAAAYHHFASQEHLVAALAEQGFQALHATLSVTPAGGGDAPARARLQAMAEAYTTFALTHQGHYRVMFRGMKLMAVTTSLNAIALATFGELVAAIGAAREEAGLDVSSSPAAAAAAWALAHGHVILALDDVWSGLGDTRDHGALARDVSVLVVALGLR